MVFDVTDEQSLNRAVELREQVYRIKDTDHIPEILVANKCDQGCDQVITREQVLEKYKNVALIEASSKDNLNIDQIFVELVKQVPLPGLRKIKQRKGG